MKISAHKTPTVVRHEDRAGACERADLLDRASYLLRRLWWLLPSSKTVLFSTMALLLLGVSLAIAAGARAKLDGRPGLGIAVGALVLNAAAILIVLAPVYLPIIAFSIPARTTTIPAQEAQESLDQELRSLGVEISSIRAVRAERRTGSRAATFYLLAIDAQGAARLKELVLQGVRAKGWTDINDSDRLIASMPFQYEPGWFDPKVYQDADFLSIGPKYRFIFCPTAGRVFFSKTSN